VSNTSGAAVVSSGDPNKRPPKSDCDRLAAQLRDSSTRNGALNELLKLSANHDSNFSLDSDAILVVLCQIVYETLEWEPRTSTTKTGTDTGRPTGSSGTDTMTNTNDSDSDEDDDDDDAPTFRSQQAWTTETTIASQDWGAHCESKLKYKSLHSETIKPFEVVLMILRNLSFVAANLRVLAYSPDILQILVGALYECTSSNNLSSSSKLGNIGGTGGGGAGDEQGSGDRSNANTNTNTSTIALPALHTLVNLAPYLDVTGQKLVCDKLFLQGDKSDEYPLLPTGNFGQASDGSWGFGGLWLAKRLDTKEDVVQDVSKELLLELMQDYLVQVWSIFPALSKVLTDSNAPRLVIIMAVDLLQEFINHARVGVVGKVEEHTKNQNELPNARAILVHMPTLVLERLLDLLHVPRLGPDALDYVDPVHNIVTRVTTLKLVMGYDATVDTDVRDRALDVLVPLLELDSPRLAQRLGVKSTNGRPQFRLFDNLMPILTTQVGRNEAPLLATQLLRELTKAKENRVGLEYLQNRIVGLARKDARMAHLAMNHLYVLEEPQAAAASSSVEAAATTTEEGGVHAAE
jgi:hypothetical protein